MEQFLSQVLSGLATGGIYASLALALVMINLATYHINFAQGEMAMLSPYVAWALITAGFPYWTAFTVTLVVSFAGGMVLDRVVLRPFQHAPALTILTAFLALYLIINSTAGWIFTYTVKEFPSPFPAQAPFGSRLISSHQLGAIALTLVLLSVVYLFFRFTTLGLAMRAAAYNPVSSRLVGIRVGLLRGMGWGLASVVGAVAGMMIAPVVFLEPNMMSGVLLYAFAAALVGGIDNPWGAAAGGFLVGVLENLVGVYLIGTELKLAMALVIIVAILLFKPSGLLGRTIVNRV